MGVLIRLQRELNQLLCIYSILNIYSEASSNPWINSLLSTFHPLFLSFLPQTASITTSAHPVVGGRSLCLCQDPPISCHQHRFGVSPSTTEIQLHGQQGNIIKTNNYVFPVIQKLSGKEAGTH